MPVTLESLKQKVKDAQYSLDCAVQELDAFETSPYNNVFASLADAGILESRLKARAHNDCEGAGNYGLEVYEQEFIVDGKHYIAELECEYDRHDKQYYFLDCALFTITPM